MDFIKEKIRVAAEKLAELMDTPLSEPDFTYLYCDTYKMGSTPPPVNTDWKTFEKGQRFCGTDTHYWLHFSLPATPESAHKKLYFGMKTGREGQWDACNPQGLVYIDGKAVQALDVNHTALLLEFDRPYEMDIYFYTGMQEGNFDVIPSLFLRDDAVCQLYYDLKVPYDTLCIIDEKSYDYIKMRDCLDKALLRLDLRDFYSRDFYESIEMTRAYLKEEFYEKLCGHSDGIISCIGHTHIDVAWLWTVAQTREKAERSFATVLNLMRQYPEYKFMSSQPQLYQHVKEANPDLYRQIKERVTEGRWEVEGAMWLEADCNLIGGESLVRQILYGKRFMKEEFGVESRMLWLPDVFGYNAALPQILRKSGVDRFFTSKIAWNETDTMPHDIFLWKGLDGTEIFTSFIESYVGMLQPDYVLKRTWEIFKDKSLSDRSLLTFGYGDGGGGPTAEMLENYRRMQYGIPGLPKLEMETATAYYDKIEADFYRNTKELRRTPKWDGELYLEMHRGTYTSIAKNKRNNRKSELLYQEAETLSVTDMIVNGGSYDSETMHKNQLNILLNQFHDIIPGSSIKEVYDVTDVEYARILKEGRAIVDEKLGAIAKNLATDGGILVYNPTAYTRSDYVRVNGKTYLAEDVPAHGYRVIADLPTALTSKVGDHRIENDRLRVLFDKSYQIVSVYDKEADREVIAAGAAANRLEIYEDYPRTFDAWEITDYYKQKMWLCDDVSEVTPIENGYRVVRKYQKSTICQDIVLKPESKRIDFVTEVDWQEDHVLLKAAFPLDIRTTEATYEVQFGHLARPTHQNTSWDAAKFEVCGHKWGDLSETGYGVSLLNDCKYGYSAEENVLSLSLLKAATYPNPTADRGKHTFTYALYPHIGGLTQGGTVQEGYHLNMPLEAMAVSASNGSLPAVYSLVSCDAENICVETVKKAEDDDSIIVRLYDSYNQKSRPTLTFGFDFQEAYLCNLMEENEKKLEFDGRTLQLPVQNFEIVTIKLVR